MTNIKITSLLFLTFGFIACNSNIKTEKQKNETVETKYNSQKKFSKIWQNFTLKNTPVIDTTNFDNFKKVKEFNDEEIELLQLYKIYPEIKKRGNSLRFHPSYKINLGNFNSVVINVLKGDHEIESILIIYDLNNKLSQYYGQGDKLTTNSLVIAYDEIAEGWSKKFSIIDNSIITIIDEFYGDNKQIDTTKFHINRLGDINKIKTKFSSNLRLNKQVLPNRIYTDTIEFSTYNDNGDYYYLEGKKNGIDLSLTYNWEWQNNDKYNFKYGDLIKVKWKIDSIFIEGDGGTLDFYERVIDAEKVQYRNKLVKFLWRAEKFDEELNQSFNSIFINEPFSNSISNQEKAALGYVATFIGNECWWDGKADQNRSNLRCKILTALDLGYQCSDEHLGFLQSWFSKDSIALKELENCGTMPYTATVQTTFDEITIFNDKESKTILVNYKAHGVNIRESIKWSWTQTDNFEYDLENITLINSEKSELTKEKIEIKEN